MHDFALSLSQARVSFFQFCDLILLLPRFPVPFQGMLNRIDEILIPEKFCQKFHRPDFIALTVIGMSPWPVIKMTRI